MSAVPTNQASVRRYRRRIIGWGAVASVLLFAVGALIFVPRVEQDLERRVVAALNDAEIAGVTVSFSGQDGTLSCRAPLDDPAAALAAGRDLRGVRTLELDASCLVGATAGTSDPPVTDPTSTTPAPATTAQPTTTARPAPTSTAPATTVAGGAPQLLQLIADDPQFSSLENAVEAAGLRELLESAGPFTLFAPTNEAFEALDPEVAGALNAAPELLADVLRHHLTSGDLRAADLEEGALPMADGTDVVVTIGDVVTVSSGETVATVLDPNLVVASGVIHVIDALLVPADLDLGVPEAEPLIAAALADGSLTLTGAVATDAQRTAIASAATSVLVAPSVTDQLVVDDSVTLSNPTVDAFAALLGVLPSRLVAGEMVLVGDGIVVSGTYVTEDDRVALQALADELGATAELVPRAAATAETAQTLEDDLNGFVTANPIVFEPNSAELSPGAATVLDRVSTFAKRLSAIRITVEGHTDSDGQPDTNVELSQARADAVVAALVERGVPEGQLVAVGVGSAEPVLVDGVEDKAASRRVEFDVETEGT